MLSGDTAEPELDALISSLEKLKSKQTLEKVNLVIPSLGEMYENGMRYHTRPQENLSHNNDCFSGSISTNLLLRSLYGAFIREKKSAPIYSASNVVFPEKIKYSVKSKSRQLVSILRSGPVKLSGLYLQCASRTEIVATFLSVLELCSTGSLAISFEGSEYYIKLIAYDVDEIIEKMSEQDGEY